MKIALIHFRVGETDGVSLEMEKWEYVLNRLGHEVVYIAGNNAAKNVFVIEEMAYNNPLDLLITDECYLRLNRFDCDGLKTVIAEQANIIKDKLIEIIHSEHIDCLVPNNIFSLGKSLPIAIGLLSAIEETGIYVVNHHHDFYWERDKYSRPTCEFVASTLKNHFPPFGDRIKQVVINSKAKKDLLARRGLDATIVPNVFDFSASLWQKDDFNKDFKAMFSLGADDVIFLQATRVTNRKSIELAIQLIAHLNAILPAFDGRVLYDGRTITSNTRFVLLVVGLQEGLDHYEEKLVDYAKKLNVKMVMDAAKISHTRTNTSGLKTYSLWDAYVFADIITYPSTYEGWGNQFLEGLFARKPMVVFEYSVFKDDIAPYDFSYISLGDTYQTDALGLHHIEDETIRAASDETFRLLLDNPYRERIVNRNFMLGEEHFSYETLRSVLQELFHF